MLVGLVALDSKRLLDELNAEKVPAGTADIKFRCDTGTLALMMYGRLDAAAAISQGSLEAEGDGQLAFQFG